MQTCVRKWATSTSLHGPADVVAAENIFLKIFWFIVTLVMVGFGSYASVRVIQEYVSGATQSVIKIKYFKYLDDVANTVKLVYCSADWLNVTKLIEHRIPNRTVIYALGLLESTMTFNEREQMGGGLKNYMELPLVSDQLGQLTGFIRPTEWDWPYNEVNNSDMIKAIEETGYTETTFMYDIQEMGFKSLGEFVFGFANIFAWNISDVANSDFINNFEYFVVRQGKVCETTNLTAINATHSKTNPFREVNNLVIFGYRHEMKQMSPLSPVNRSFSLYTGPKVVDSPISYLYENNMRHTNLQLNKQKRVSYKEIVDFQLVNYNNKPSMFFKCEQFSTKEGKYPFDADAARNCDLVCVNEQYALTNKCTPLTFTPNIHNASLEAIPCERFVNNEMFRKYLSYTWEEMYRIMDSDECAYCNEVQFCNTWKITIEAIRRTDTDDDSITRDVHDVYDTIQLRVPASYLQITSSLKYTEMQFLSQIGGNMGLFLGASWMSLIHIMISLICCCKCWNNKRDKEQTGLPTFNRNYHVTNWLDKF